MKLNCTQSIDGLPDDAMTSDANLGPTAQAASDAAMRVWAAAYPDRFNAGDVSVSFVPDVTFPVSLADLAPADPPPTS